MILRILSFFWPRLREHLETKRIIEEKRKAGIPSFNEYCRIIKRHRPEAFQGNREKRQEAERRLRSQYRNFVAQAKKELSHG